jgi:carbon monoxide dehydrogenase subunit G
MIRKIIYVLLGLIAALLIAGFLLPRQVTVTRSTHIDRPPADIIPWLVSLKKFNEWSPWFNKDPNAKYTYSGPESGVGAKVAWAGNKDVGEGTQEITSVSESKVDVALAFGGQGPATAQYTLIPDQTGTNLTWTLNADMGASPIGHLFGPMMDSMVGKDYVIGLSNLKRVVEAAPKVVPVDPQTAPLIDGSFDVKSTGATPPPSTP